MKKKNLVRAGTEHAISAPGYELSGLVICFLELVTSLSPSEPQVSLTRAMKKDEKEKHE